MAVMDTMDPNGKFPSPPPNKNGVRYSPGGGLSSASVTIRTESPLATSISTLASIPTAAPVTSTASFDTAKTTVSAPAIEPASSSLPSKPAFSAATADTATSLALARRSRSLSRLFGPSPEKGSGQDRFRQMMNSAPRSPRKNEDKGKSTRSTLAHQPATETTLPPPPPDTPPPPPPAMSTNTSLYGGSIAGLAPANFALKPAATISSRGAGVGQATTMPPRIKLEGGTSPKPNGNGNGNGNRNGTASYTATLSAECQKRRFNPKFSESVIRDGSYKCSVTLRDKTIRDSRAFNSANEAKQAIAKRAIAEVRKMPRTDVAPDAAARVRTESDSMLGAGGRAQIKNEHPSAKSQLPTIPPITREQRMDIGGWPLPAPVASSYLPQPTRTYQQGGYQSYDRREEHKHLLGRVQALYGQSGNGPSPHIMSDPLASQAFLEGFALGGRLEGTARRQYEGPSHPQHAMAMGGAMGGMYAAAPYPQAYHQRERSPVSMPSRNRRERSPLRRRMP